MKRPVRSARSRLVSAGPPRGYTLVEILVATVLTLVMVAVVVKLFGSIGESVSNSRAILETSDRVRTARTRLEMDLAGITATMLPPLRPEAAEGYFEYIEGPVGPVLRLTDELPYAVDEDADPSSPADFTVGDVDDILMFTTRSAGRPFVGRYWDPIKRTQSTVESDVAEVAWFLRGRTLYRRVMLVVPGLLGQLDTRDPKGVLTLAEVVPSNSPDAKKAFFYWNDVSVRAAGTGEWIPNSLSDLTRRECRFAHDIRGFPFDARGWGQLGLPTLRECSSPSWGPGRTQPIGKFAEQIDLWNDPHPWPGVDSDTGTLTQYRDGLRIAEDVILTNVISFDVKAWDPGAPVYGDGSTALGPSDPGYKDLFAKAPVIGYGAYVDLGYAPNYTAPAGAPLPRFHHLGDARSALNATDAEAARVYDTWSLHYEHDGIDQDGRLGPDQGTNGFDDDGNGIVDDASEMETSPPYPVPLRAIQVKIRVFEPDSRQIREVTVVQDFLPK